MIYRSSWHGLEVQISSRNMAKTQIWCTWDAMDEILIFLTSDSESLWKSGLDDIQIVMIGGDPISPTVGLKHTDMTIYDVAGGILYCWLQIQYLCENPVQMIYRSSWLVESLILMIEIPAGQGGGGKWWWEIRPPWGSWWSIYHLDWIFTEILNGKSKI